MGKKIIISVALFCLVFISVGMLKAKAGSTENASGWLWGGTTNVGWVSVNNTNMKGAVSYGINIPETDGELKGYSWSENLGAIAFDDTGGYLTNCPAAPCTSRRVGDKLEGWARFVEIKKALAINNSGGWQGWIKLNPNKGGVSIDTASGKLKGYAWSDELGWIDFSKAKIGPATPVCTLKYICSKTKPKCPQTTGTASCINNCTNSGVDSSLCGENCKPETITCQEPSNSGIKGYNYREVAP